MRRYAVADEVRVALARRLKDWRKAGLLSTEQEQALRADLATDLRRTGLMLRLGLAAFTVIAGAAAVGLAFLVTDIRSEVAVSITCGLLAAAALGAATVLVRDAKLYRHGVEEALAVGAVGLAAFAVGLLSTEVFSNSSGSQAWFFAMVAVTAMGVEVYRRFGLQYVAVGALYAAALLPMAFSSIGTEAKRLFAALVCAGAFVAASRARRLADNDVRRDDAEVLRAAALAGAYLALNTQILIEPFGRGVDRWFHWGTWGLTWILPVVGVRLAVADRDPLLLRIALASGLASVLTNKSYLGWPRQPWDPMLLGVLLIAVALVLRRWLATGTDGERNGFTARQLVESEGATIQAVSLVSVAAQPLPERHPHEPADPSFTGGRSGGGGGGSEF